MTEKKKVRIIRQISVTPGGRHAWFEAEVDGKVIKIRKPIGFLIK